jgi:dTMP kinase
MRGKLIVIEGTDCSGKETQSNLLIEALRRENIKVEKFSFPSYDTPTGKIVGGPYLGKEYICEGWFPEGASNVDFKVASLYYAADRRYNIEKIESLLDNGVNVILDRYVYSNMAHQGGKVASRTRRYEIYRWLESLEFGFLELPRSDINIFLHMPYEHAVILSQKREEKRDQHEKNTEHLKSAERSYVEISKYYEFKTIECVRNNEVRKIEDIHEELKNYVFKELKKK